MKYEYFQDFEAFIASVGDVDSTMMFQNPTRHSWSMYHVYLPEIHFQLGQLSSGNIVEGQSRSNGYVFYLPLSDTCAYSANGTVLPKNSFIIMEPGCDFCISTKAEHDWCSIFVPSHKLAATSELVESSSGSEKMRCRVSRPNPQLAAQFRALVSPLMTTAANYSEFESAPAATCAAAELLKVASLIIGQGQGGKLKLEGRPKLSREEIIRRSKNLLEEREGKTVLVGELAARSRVSERTLRTAFKEYFGVGPARYLQLRQLHQVHRALKAADPEAVNTSNVLLKHGVWEFTHFASRYRRLFGELPSQTLQRKSSSVIKSFQSPRHLID